MNWHLANSIKLQVECHHHFLKLISVPAPQLSCEAVAKSSGSSAERFDPDRERAEIMKRLTKASGV